jgi:hypothetical protein
MKKKISDSQITWVRVYALKKSNVKSGDQPPFPTTTATLFHSAWFELGNLSTQPGQQPEQAPTRGAEAHQQGQVQG